VAVQAGGFGRAEQGMGEGLRLRRGGLVDQLPQPVACDGRL
jgi:hypothetical protein